MNREAIKTRYVREGLLYSRNNLKKLFDFKNEEDFRDFLNQLKKYRILKTKRFSNSNEDESLIEDDDDDYIENGSSIADLMYLFRFVGIVYVCNRIVKVYPKYIISSSTPKSEMDQVLRVLLKYKKRWEHNFFSYLAEGEEEKTNILSLILFLLDDYNENGLYQNEERLFETNGDGRIEWQRTVDDTVPVFNNRKPYYVEFITEHTADNENDFIHRLHAAVLSECSRQLEAAELISIFGFQTAEISDEKIEDLGDIAYIKNCIENEMMVQFDDHKRLVLNALLDFITEEGNIMKNKNGLTFFGTRTFHNIWEDVCAQVFKSQRNVKLGELLNCPPIDYSYISPKNANSEFIDLIERPIWFINKSLLNSNSTFIPDYISVDFYNNEYVFYILDAKYYFPDWSGVTAKRCPGVEDIAKQYLYYLAYKSFLDHHGIKNVKNYFLMPKESGSIENIGYAKLEILHAYYPDDIGVRMLPATFLYDCYLKNPIKTIDLSELG